MNTNTEGSPHAWPVAVEVALLGEGGAKGTVQIRPGITTLVGPNGSGKTRALRAIKTHPDISARTAAHNRKVYFLAAGRSTPFEDYRAAVNHPFVEPSDAAVGEFNYRDRWWDYESVTGSLLMLDNRADLRLKIEARLQQLFDRSIKLTWSQRGLNVNISPSLGGAPYAANHEASGIRQLVGLLAAIHNDEIGALLIDEPEISLHPQHQAFLLEEMEGVAGDPSEPTKKLIAIATHSTSLLPLRKITELQSVSFFTSVRRPPAQVPGDADILKRVKLTALISRLSATHRMAMFAENVLLVEGPTDELIATQLARQLKLRLLARNAQILPVIGKGEFGEAAKLFRLINKRVAILADLDALADENNLVRHFSDLPSSAETANRLGRTSLADLDRDLRAALQSFITEHEVAVDEMADICSDWSSDKTSALTKRRLTLARVLTDPASFGGKAAAEASGLRTRYDALLNALAELGCFFLRRGAIEKYYGVTATDRGKPDLAAEEAASFEVTSAADLKENYADVVAALLHVAPNQRVDEDQLLRPKLGATLTAAFLEMNHESSDEQLNASAKRTIGDDADVFKLSNCSKEDLRIKVEVASPLFQRGTFPFEISRNENPNVVVPKKLPGTE